MGSYECRKPEGTYELEQVAWADRPRWLASNLSGWQDRPVKWHRAYQVASIGAKGSLFGFYWRAACGARIGNAFGYSVSTDEPHADDTCARCARMKWPPAHVFEKTKNETKED